MAHVVLGIKYSVNGQSGKAFEDISKGVALSPVSSFANFHYGYSWQHLPAADKAKFGTEQQAKAALLKAVRIGKGDVKKAAQKALMVAMKPK